LDTGLLGSDGGELATAPLGVEGAMLQGVLVDEAIEVLFQRTGDFGRSPGAGAIPQPPRALGGKAMDPRAEGGIGKGEGVRDGVQALAFDDLAHGLGTAEDAGFPGLLYEGI